MTLTLVTGATGWLGRRLLKALREGLPDVPALAEPREDRSIRCLVPTGAPLTSLAGLRDVEVVRGDLRDPAALREFCHGAEGATLFHSAGLIHPRWFVRELFDVNVNGTRLLLAAAEQAGVRRAVVVSSNSPVGVSTQATEVFDESWPYRPSMAYGRSKMLMEHIVHAVWLRRQMETVLVRPPWFYGPDQPPRQTLFFSMIREGRAPLVGSGTNRRSMAYVDNICQGLLLAEHAPQAAGRTYWIADRRPYTMHEIVGTVEQLMADEFGMSVRRQRMRLPSVVGTMATWADGAIQAAGMYQQKVHVLSEMNKTIACSTRKAEQELGYDPHIDLREGMRRSLAWCLAQGMAI